MRLPGEEKPSVLAFTKLLLHVPLILNLLLQQCDGGVFESYSFDLLKISFAVFFNLKSSCSYEILGLGVISVCWLVQFDKPMEILPGANRDKIRD